MGLYINRRTLYQYIDSQDLRNWLFLKPISALKSSPIMLMQMTDYPPNLWIAEPLANPLTVNVLQVGGACRHGNVRVRCQPPSTFGLWLDTLAVSNRSTEFCVYKYTELCVHRNNDLVVSSPCKAGRKKTARSVSESSIHYTLGTLLTPWLPLDVNLFPASIISIVLSLY